MDPHHTHSAPDERFAVVTFDLDGDALHSPHWRHMKRVDIEALIGGPVTLPRAAINAVIQGRKAHISRVHRVHYLCSFAVMVK